MYFMVNLRGYYTYLAHVTNNFVAIWFQKLLVLKMDYFKLEMKEDEIKVEEEDTPSTLTSDTSLIP